MNSEIEITNSNIIDEKENFKWILGNLFFTSILVLIAVFQLYIYYQNSNKAKYICFASFFFIFIGLFTVSKNIPLSLLTAMLISNLLFKCGNVQILNNDEHHDHDEPDEHEEHKEHDYIKKQKKVKEKPKKNIKKEKPDEKEPLPDLEQKKQKDNYIKGSNFEPYLTGNKNNFAYPAAPDILKFQ